MREVKTYYEDGSIQSISRYDEVTGFREGLQEFYYMSGQIHVEENYKENDRDGDLHEYLLNGIKKRWMQHRNGLRNGICETYYDETGSIYIRETYQMGQCQLYEEFYDNPDTQNQIQHKLILPNDGLYQEFYPDGTLLCRVPHVNGFRHGLYETFDETGKKTTEGMYENGVLKVETIQDFTQITDPLIG